jgi:tetratricopeptide (TPR) repeat protein
MRTQFSALALVICAAATAPAHAQAWGLQAPGRGLSNMGIVEYQSRDWMQCAGQEDQTPPQRAISACGRIIGERISRETTASALYYRSVLYRQAGETQRADADVNRAIELLAALIQAEPGNDDALNNLVFLRSEKRDFVGAAMDYSRIAALRPQAVEPRLHQGEFLFRGGDYISAASAFDMVAQIDPTNAPAQSGRCEARVAANRELDLAQQACADALRLSNYSAAALFSQGFMHFKQGDFEAALNDFQAAGRQDNTNPFAAYGYAVASLRLGRNEAPATELLASVTGAVPEVEMYARAGMAR